MMTSSFLISFLCIGLQSLSIIFFLKLYPVRQKAVLFAGALFGCLSFLLLFKKYSTDNELLQVLILLFWQTACLNDLCTWTFSWKWLIPGALLPGLAFIAGEMHFFAFLNLIFPLLCLPMIYLKQMGSADFWFVLFAAILLSTLQMSVCFILASVIGIIWGLLDRNHLIPYISCLAFAFVLSMLLENSSLF